MEASKCKQRVTRTRVNGASCWNSAGYCGPSGSGESCSEPRRGNSKALHYFRGVEPSSVFAHIDSLIRLERGSQQRATTCRLGPPAAFLAKERDQRHRRDRGEQRQPGVPPHLDDRP